MLPNRATGSRTQADVDSRTSAAHYARRVMDLRSAIFSLLSSFSLARSTALPSPVAGGRAAI